MKNELVERVSGLFDEFVTERDRSLEEAFVKMKQENGRVEVALNGFTEEYSRKADEVMTRGQELSTSLEKKGEQCKRLRDGAIKVIRLFHPSAWRLIMYPVPWRRQRHGPGRSVKYAGPCHDVTINVLRRDNTANPCAELDNRRW
jgi:hypothetical protein